MTGCSVRLRLLIGRSNEIDLVTYLVQPTCATKATKTPENRLEANITMTQYSRAPDGPSDA